MAPPISVPSTLSTPHAIRASTSISKVSKITQGQETDCKTDGVTSKSPSVDNPTRGTKRSAENSEAGPSSANKLPRKSDNPPDTISDTSRASDMPRTEIESSSYNNRGLSRLTDSTGDGPSNKRPQKPDQKRKRPKQQTMFIPKKRTWMQGVNSLSTRYYWMTSPKLFYNPKDKNGSRPQIHSLRHSEALLVFSTINLFYTLENVTHIGLPYLPCYMEELILN
jgi:hypothetical protein